MFEDWKHLEANSSSFQGTKIAKIQKSNIFRQKARARAFLLDFYKTDFCSYNK